VDKLTGVQTQVNQVKEVMQQNVDQMLQTHEKLEDLETKAGACASSHRRTRARADTHADVCTRVRKADSVWSTAYYCEHARTNGIAKNGGRAEAHACRPSAVSRDGSRAGHAMRAARLGTAAALSAAADNMRNEAQKFKKSAGDLKKQQWWKNMKARPVGVLRRRAPSACSVGCHRLAWHREAN
jgi:hypothetical protein